MTDASDTAIEPDAPSCDCRVSELACAESSMVREGGYVAMGFEGIPADTDIVIEVFDCDTNASVASTTTTEVESVCTELPPPNPLWSSREPLVTDAGCYYAIMTALDGDAERVTTSVCHFDVGPTSPITDLHLCEGRGL